MCISAGMLSMISTAVSVISSLSQASQKQDYYDYQAEQARADAQAEREAADVRAEKIRKLGTKQQSEAKAALAGAGVEVGAGTPVRIAQQIQKNAEEDARQELLYGERQAKRLEASADGYLIAGDNAMDAGMLRAGGSLLEGWQKSNWVKSSLADDYNGTWTARSPFSSRTYDKQIWD